MNGITASILFSGDTARREDIKMLEAEMKLMQPVYGPEVEIVIYFSKPTKLKSRHKNIVFTYSKILPAHQSGIVAASGETLIFTTLKNFLADPKNKALNQALDVPVKAVAVPKSGGGLLARIRPLKFRYFIAKKKFVLKLAASSETAGSLIGFAVKLNRLEYLEPTGVHYPDYIYCSRSDFSDTPTPLKQRKTSGRIHFTDDIPTFIICRDRLSPLKQLVQWCEAEGLKNLIFIDNNSSYPPLLDYYSSTPYEVIKLNHNVGYLSPWMTGAIDIYASNKPYIVSDVDIVPLKEAHGAVRLFCRLLNEHRKYVKAGFGLKIDDLPKSYEPRNYVIEWEKQYWKKEVEKDVYDAAIDTTFALWRANQSHTWGPSLRTGGKYVARHVTWYINSKSPTAEMRYYRDHVDKVVNTWSTESSELPELYISHRQKKPAKRTPTI